jgi:heptosyltransferase-2
LLADTGIVPGKFVVFAPGSVWLTKRWPAIHYRTMAELLLSGFGLKVLAVGGPADTDVCRSVVLEPNHNLSGRLSVLQTSALMGQARLVVSGDTAPAHLATSVRARQAIIFGSTVPRFGFAPPTPNARTLGLDLWCRPCTTHGRRFCPRWNSLKCLRDIRPELVVDSVRDWLISAGRD